jgi:hypothetical protein
MQPTNQSCRWKRAASVSCVAAGLAFTGVVDSPEGLYDDRFTVDLVWRF